MPELGVEDTMVMEPIEGVERIARERWHLNCSVCKQKAGAKVQCSKCYTAFHPLCGRVRGLRMEMIEPPAPHMALVTRLHCHKHCTPAPGTLGLHLKRAPSRHPSDSTCSKFSAMRDGERGSALSRRLRC